MFVNAGQIKGNEGRAGAAERLANAQANKDFYFWKSSRGLSLHPIYRVTF